MQFSPNLMLMAATLLIQIKLQILSMLLLNIWEEEDLLVNKKLNSLFKLLTKTLMEKLAKYNYTKSLRELLDLDLYIRIDSSFNLYATLSYGHIKINFKESNWLIICSDIFSFVMNKNNND